MPDTRSTDNSVMNHQGKHRNYQAIPMSALDANGSIAALTGGKYEDEKRYAWLKAALGQFCGHVTDIGANLGFFSYRMLEDFDTRVTAYEPFAPHVSAMTEIRDSLRKTEVDLTIRKQGVALHDVANLEPTDLLIFLNVLHHAGDDFDSDLVRNVTQWREYATLYLKELRDKCGMLFFQLGYTWMGWSKKICDDEEIIDFTGELLTNAGWSVSRMGLIENYRNPVTYANRSYERSGGNVVALPEQGRNISCRLLRKVGKERTVTMPYRFAQRPLWLCK